METSGNELVRMIAEAVASRGSSQNVELLSALARALDEANEEMGSQGGVCTSVDAADGLDIVDKVGPFPLASPKE